MRNERTKLQYYKVIVKKKKLEMELEWLEWCLNKIMFNLFER